MANGRIKQQNKYNKKKVSLGIMNSEDLWTGLGAAVSTILSGLSWFYGIGILQALFPFIAGALVTYFVQSRLQDRSEKRKLRVKAIEELHIPLFLEIESVKEDLLLDLKPFGFGRWNQIAEKPQLFTLEYRFREQLLSFFEKAKKITSHLESIRRITAGIIYENVETILFPVLQENGMIEMHAKAETLEIDKWKEGTGFGLQLQSLHLMPEAPIPACAILNLDPIDYLEKEWRKFEMDQIILFLKVRYHIGGSWKEQNFSIPMKEHAALFRDFWKKVMEAVHENADIKAFNKARLELMPISDDISTRLTKHIEKYITIENI